MARLNFPCSCVESLLMHTQPQFVVSKRLKNSHSSNQWLQRQFSDPYVRHAQQKNFRCRSAFKLLEIDEKHKILSPGMSVVDCGAAPGSWTQVAVEKVNANEKHPKIPVGTVIGVDRLPFTPVEGAILLPQSDFTLPATQAKIKEILGGKPVDAVLSDMAPNATGVKNLDHDLIIKLAYSAVRFALQMTKPGGVCLVKVWDGEKASALFKDISRFYKIVQFVKPNASRADSSEKFILARNFLGIKS